METAVREVYAGLLPLVGERRVQLEISPLPEALGDPAMVRQVLVNLLTNAVKYTGPRDPAVIEVNGWEDPQTTGYCVRDNGIGFDPRHHEKIFDSFTRDDTREIPAPGRPRHRQADRRKHGGVWATGAVGKARASVSRCRTTAANP
jgi:signal transduction histidine kinase